MTKKKTRESIEAELSASESERLLRGVEELVHDFNELEADFERLEQEKGLPVDRTKPLAERMASVGMSKQAIDRISSLFDASDKIRLGRMDEVPEDIRRKLAESADAEISALDQLQDVLDARAVEISPAAFLPVTRVVRHEKSPRSRSLCAVRTEPSFSK